MRHEPKTYRIKTAAEIYDVPPKVLRDWCLTGKIKAKKEGRAWYIPVEELQKHFMGGVHGSTKGTARD